MRIMSLYITDHVAIYAMLVLLALIVVLQLLNWLVRNKVNAVERYNQELQYMMEQALSMGEYYTVKYDIKTGRWDNTHGSLLPVEGMTMKELLKQLHPEDYNTMRLIVKRLLKGEISQSDIDFRWHYIADNDNEHATWLYAHGQIVVEYDKEGHPLSLISIAKNVTPEIESELADDVLLKRFRKIFDTSLVAMTFYDKEGRLISINQNMRKLCEFDETREAFFRNTLISEMELIKDDFDPDSHAPFHICQHMYFPNLDIDKYVEMRVSPILDDSGNIVYYCVTAQEMTGERSMYLDQVQRNRQLREADEAINKYENELHNLLTNNRMYICSTDYANRTISFSTSLRKMDFTESFDQYMDRMYDEDKVRAAAYFSDPEFLSKPYNAIRHFHHSPSSNKPSWQIFTTTPIFDNNGQLKGQFALKRDVTRLMEAQEQLKRETTYADESGKLKSMFLANMTHEIRTPLNAIVGFSGLLQLVDEGDERREFIRIIRNNCDMLLRLINDILEASNMGQALSIKPESIDFATVFEDICQTLAQRVQEPGVEFLKDNPYDTFRTCVDKGRLQQVFTNFVTNAVKYTHDGHIRVGYRAESRDVEGEVQTGLYIYCEDTGAGIPLDKQDSVFERFVKLNDSVQGTGLGLSICKTIAERCNGVIGLNSEGEGHGSTFWMWIPCPTEYEKKKIVTSSQNNADE